MHRTKVFKSKWGIAAGLILFLISAANQALFGQSFDIPNKKWGLSFGNSPEFTGLRFNFRDNQVRHIRGVNITLWQPRKDNKDSVIDGISFGLIPGGGTLRGVQIGILGASAEKMMSGINIGGLGVGCGGDVSGINIGGLGVGAGNDMIGINIGGLGMGAGKNLRGINIGGLGAGAGEDIIGVNIGGLGIGASRNAQGINIGGLGAGAGQDMIGINIGGLGLGAGRRLAGINISGFGAGAGQRLTGLTICGFAAGSTEVLGLTIGGFAVGGEFLKGIHLAGGMVHVVRGGQMVGFAASPFNYFRGSQNGLAIGIVNYAFRVKGVQIGLINFVRDNPKYLKVLPVMNTSF
jgi:hypothetical protein